MKLNKIIFTVIRLLFFIYFFIYLFFLFLGGREADVASNKLFFAEKKYKYFIGYLYNSNKVKPLHIILPKISAYVKSYDGQAKLMYFLIEEMNY